MYLVFRFERINCCVWTQNVLKAYHSQLGVLDVRKPRLPGSSLPQLFLFNVLCSFSRYYFSPTLFLSLTQNIQLDAVVVADGDTLRTKFAQHSSEGLVDPGHELQNLAVPVHTSLAEMQRRSLSSWSSSTNSFQTTSPRPDSTPLPQVVSPTHAKKVCYSSDGSPLISL